MRNKQEIKDWLLENCVDKDGDLDLSGLDFLDFDGSIYINFMKTNGSLHQNNQKVNGYLWQDDQEVNGDLYQNRQKVNGAIWQDRQVSRNLFQDEDEDY